MPNNPAPVKKHCSLQEALEIVGRRAFPAEWTGQEAKLPPKDFATLRRFVRSTRALLALLHNGRVTAWFIPDGSTLEEQRQKIIQSSWPSPAWFLAKPPFGDLWFDIVSSRGARRPKPEDNPPAWYQRFANTPLWHTYSPLVGRIELDQEALRLASGDGTGQFSAADQEPEENAAPSTRAPRKKAPKPRGRGGRKPGSGAYTNQDRVLWEKMKAALDAGDAKSTWEAAGQFAEEAPGTPEVENKRSRLAKGYRTWINS